MTGKADFSEELLLELPGLIEQCVSDRATPEQIARLDRLMTENPQAHKLYVRYVHTLCGLRTWGEYPLAEPMSDDLGSEAIFPPEEVPDGDRPFAVLSSLPASSGGGWHGTLGYLSTHEFLTSYLVATVLFGVAALVGWNVSVSCYSELPAGDQTVLAPPKRPRQAEDKETIAVGRISGTAECRWADAESAHTGRQPSVSVGRRYALISGLLEISYDSGAKVILQGPCNYEVDSASGGFLSLGKLTARVEKNDECGMMNDELRTPAPDIHHSSLITHHLFSVRTPTAVVTDLGTEFGVEVDKSGTTRSHVFRGKIEVRPVDGDVVPSANGRGAGAESVGQPIQLVAGESVRVLKGNHRQAPTMVRGRANAAAFPARPGHLAEYVEEQRLKPFRRWQAYSQQLRKDPSLVAYYTFEAVTNPRTLPNVTAAGRVLDGRVDSGEWVGGRLPGKFALYFHGPGSGDRVVLPEQNRFKFSGPFSVAVWFKAERFTAMYQALVTKGDASWRLQRNGWVGDCLAFDVNYDRRGYPGHFCRAAGRTAVADGRWHLAVAVYESAGGAARQRLYVDGRPDGVGDWKSPFCQNDEAVCLGANGEYPGREFQGLIDEVAVFSRALSAEEVVAAFQAGKPADRVERKDGGHAPRISEDGPPVTHLHSELTNEQPSATGK